MTAVLQRIKKLWELTGSDFLGEVHYNEPKTPSEPFVTFPCPECDFPQTVGNFVYPGDAIVIICTNCNASITIYSEQLHIFRTKDIPPGKLQDVVWGKLSE